MKNLSVANNVFLVDLYFTTKVFLFSVYMLQSERTVKICLVPTPHMMERDFLEKQENKTFKKYV